MKMTDVILIINYSSDKELITILGFLHKLQYKEMLFSKMFSQACFYQFLKRTLSASHDIKNM